MAPNVPWARLGDAACRRARGVLERVPRRVAVRGSSMAPTLADGDVVLVLPGARVRPGQVSLVRWPARPGQLSVKRLALRLDGPPGSDGPEPAPGAVWFALGDAPSASTDSRTLGPAEALAPVVWRLWPGPGPVRAR